MAKLKDLLPYISYGTALDIVEQDKVRGFVLNNRLFSNSDLITREVIEKHHSELLERELSNGIHAEGVRPDTIVIPIKKDIVSPSNKENDVDKLSLIALTDGTGMGDTILVIKTNAPIEELKKISNDIYINGGDCEDISIWADILIDKGYIFKYIE